MQGAVERTRHARYGGSTGTTARRTRCWRPRRSEPRARTPGHRRVRDRRSARRSDCLRARCCPAPTDLDPPAVPTTPDTPRRRPRTGPRRRTRPRAAPACRVHRGARPWRRHPGPGPDRSPPAPSACASATGPPMRRRKERAAESAPAPPRAGRPTGRHLREASGRRRAAGPPGLPARPVGTSSVPSRGCGSRGAATGSGKQVERNERHQEKGTAQGRPLGRPTLSSQLVGHRLPAH